MSSHYVGTAELRNLSNDLLGVLHRFPTDTGFTEYWMVKDEFHLWEVGPAYRYNFEFLGRNINNDKIAYFKSYGKSRFTAVGVPTGQLKLWVHAIANEPL